GLAQRLRAARRRPDQPPVVYLGCRPPHADAEFEGSPALLHQLAGPVRLADVGVAGDVVANHAAEELVDRLAVGFAGDVPERLLDRADRAEDCHPTAPEAVPVHPLPEVLDAGGVFADDEAREVVDRRRDGPLLHLQRALAPAVNPFVGLHLDEAVLTAGRFHDVSGDTGDFQHTPKWGTGNGLAVPRPLSPVPCPLSPIRF